MIVPFTLCLLSFGSPRLKGKHEHANLAKANRGLIWDWDLPLVEDRRWKYDAWQWLAWILQPANECPMPTVGITWSYQGVACVSPTLWRHAPLAVLLELVVVHFYHNSPRRSCLTHPGSMLLPNVIDGNFIGILKPNNRKCDTHGLHYFLSPVLDCLFGPQWSQTHHYLLVTASGVYLPIHH